MNCPKVIMAGDFDERWLSPGSVIPVDMQTTGALVREIQRLRRSPELVQLELEDFLRIVNTKPDCYGIPVFYAEWPKRK